MALDTTAQTAFEAMAEAHDLKAWDKVVALGDAWVDARGEMPGLAMVWYGQGLMAKYRLEDALPFTSFAVDALKDADPIAYCAALSNYGQALARAGRWSEARQAFKQMAALPLTDGEAREKQGHVLLALSDKWRTGWAMTEGRLEAAGRGLLPNCRAWDGVTKEPVAVLHEQGIGDAVLIARWLPEIARRTGHQVTWYGPELLHRWVSLLAPDVLIGTAEAAQASPDLGAAVRAMSLPHLLGVDRPSDVPAPVAPWALIEKRARRAPTPGALKVGVCWQGSSGGWHDFERSFPASEFAAIWGALDGVEFVNLTHGVDAPDNAPFAARSFADVYETGEVITGLDLVVSVDTAIVHIAGSLGVPTLALVPTVPDWRYQWPHGGTTPFYPSVTVLRKKHLLDTSVITKARALVEKFATAVQRMAA